MLKCSAKIKFLQSILWNFVLREKEWRTTMRKILLALLIMGINITGVSAAGTITSNLLVTDPANAKVKVSGSIGEAASKELSLLIKKSDAEFFEGDNLTGKNFYTKTITTDMDGSFELEFVFDAESGLYEVYFSDLYNSGSGYVYDFNYIAYEEVLEFVIRLGENSVKEQDMIAELNRYSDSLGIGFEEIENFLKKEYISEDIINNSEIIKADKIDGLKRVVNFSGSRFDILNGIYEAKLPGDVYNVITENAALAELPSEIILDFNNLKSSKQTEVCKKLLGKDFTYDEFLKTFEEEIESIKKAVTVTGGNSGSGGGSPVSNKTGISGGGYVMTTESDESDAAVKYKFGDIEDVPWAIEAIEYLAEQGIVNGVGENKFDPNGELTREQFAKLIVEAYNCYDENAECIFSDVQNGSWAEKYIASAFDNGLMNGISETEFGIGKNVIRQDAALVLYRFAKLIGVEMTAAELDFDDAEEISEYAKEAVSAMYGTGIINGMDNNTFAPKNTITRAQACKMLYEVMKRGVEG